MMGLARWEGHGWACISDCGNVSKVRVVLDMREKKTTGKFDRKLRPRTLWIELAEKEIKSMLLPRNEI